MARSAIILFMVLSATCVSSSDIEDAAPAPERVPVIAGFFSTPQADRGRRIFELVCSECHDTSDFRGDDFEWEWRRRTVWDFYRRMRETMPEDNPGSLSPETYTDVIAYILQLNEYASGETELVADEGRMDTIPMGPGADKTGRSVSTGNGR